MQFDYYDFHNDLSPSLELFASEGLLKSWEGLGFITSLGPSQRRKGDCDRSF